MGKCVKRKENGLLEESRHIYWVQKSSRSQYIDFCRFATIGFSAVVNKDGLCRLKRDVVEPIN